MQRRAFVAAGAAVIADCRLRTADSSPPTPQSTIRNPQSAQEPSLSPEVFARRLDRARGELKARGLDLLFATPSTNYEYLTGYNPGRSERLIALLLPVVGAPAIVCPSFEVERIKRHSIVTELHGWEEQEDPHALVRETVRRLRPGSGGGTIALESSTAYQTFLQLGRALPGWKFVDAGPVTDRLRVIKSPEEVALLRRAIAITLDAMAATSPSSRSARPRFRSRKRCRAKWSSGARRAAGWCSSARRARYRTAVPRGPSSSARPWC